VGLDHPWLRERPELFVQSPAQREGTFARETAGGTRWIAHGRDPWFAPWIDTAQLDYRRAATRAAMLETLRAVAARCDGVRCDMAMLVLNDVFAQTWRAFPTDSEPPPREFWEEAIPAIRREHPEFLFLAEVYWDLEARLQALGFDFTYDKPLYDALVWRNAAGAQWRVLERPPSFTARCAHFLENHDEPRIATILSLPEHRAAALTVMGLPGMRFLHEGQLTGARIKVPVQLARRPVEPPDAAIAGFYERLLRTLPQTAVGRGEPRILTPRAAWADNPTGQNFILVQWQSAPPEFDLVAVNLAPHRSQCYAPLSAPGLAEHNWRLRDLLGDEVHERYGEDLATQGLYLDLLPHGAQLFHFEPLT
jgi:hypothetical protein